MTRTGSSPSRIDDVAAAAKQLRAQGIESVAIGFLHAYANPDHERRASEITKAALPGTYVTSSHEILPVWREYERFSTTVVSAYCGPAVERYLRSLEARRAEVKMVRCGLPGKSSSWAVVPRPVQTRSGMRATAFPDSMSRIWA